MSGVSFNDLLSQADAASTSIGDTRYTDAFKEGGPQAVEELEREELTAHGEHGGSTSDGDRDEIVAPDDPAAAEIEPEAIDDDTVDFDCDEPDRDDPPVSLQLTDHQEAAQSAAMKGGSNSSGSDASLPISGFRLGGVERQPHIRSLPDSVVDVLRERLRSAAVRELGVDDSVAREFSERLSQGTLATAFLLAQLDVRLDADPATQRACELFRSDDPLLGAAVARLEAMADETRKRDALLTRMRAELREVRETSAVVEQALAFSIADRAENLMRGEHNASAVAVTHKSAMVVRDRAREMTRKQQQMEKERDGRPIR